MGGYGEGGGGSRDGAIGLPSAGVRVEWLPDLVMDRRLHAVREDEMKCCVT